MLAQRSVANLHGNSWRYWSRLHGEHRVSPGTEFWTGYRSNSRITAPSLSSTASWWLRTPISKPMPWTETLCRQPSANVWLWGFWKSQGQGAPATRSTVYQTCFGSHFAIRSGRSRLMNGRRSRPRARRTRLQNRHEMRSQKNRKSVGVFRTFRTSAPTERSGTPPLRVADMVKGQDGSSARMPEKYHVKKMLGPRWVQKIGHVAQYRHGPWFESTGEHGATADMAVEAYRGIGAWDRDRTESIRPQNKRVASEARHCRWLVMRFIFQRREPLGVWPRMRFRKSVQPDVHRRLS